MRRSTPPAARASCARRQRTGGRGAARAGGRVQAPTRRSTTPQTRHDLPRPGRHDRPAAPGGARRRLRTCEQAGIRAVMITGDHPSTAQAVARELGLLQHGSRRDRRRTGRDERRPSSSARSRTSTSTRASRRRTSCAWSPRCRRKGHIVAMTGDGVNDAPALKKADIGIAMGITGTDVTKEAAAMTLTDDNFASIVAAVEEGRGIFGNIKKYLMYLLSSNIGEIGLMAGAALLGTAAAADRRADPLRQPRHRRPAGAGAGGRPARAGPDAPPAARPAHRHLHPPRRDADDGGRHLVDAGQPGPVRLGARTPAAARPRR